MGYNPNTTTTTWGLPSPASPYMAPASSAANVFTSQPGQAPPTEPATPTIHLKLNEPAPLSEEQLFEIYHNLQTYQQQGYPLAQWNLLNQTDQATLEQAGIQPQGGVAASSPQSSSLSTGAVVAIVAGVGIAGGAIWYFGFRK